VSDFNFIRAGSVEVVTTSDGGHSLEFFAEGITRKIISVGDEMPGPIRDQALAFRDLILQVVLDGLKRAQASDRAYFTSKNHQ
jgi:hypothetical protein